MMVVKMQRHGQKVIGKEGAYSGVSSMFSVFLSREVNIYNQSKQATRVASYLH